MPNGATREGRAFYCKFPEFNLTAKAMSGSKVVARPQVMAVPDSASLHSPAEQRLVKIVATPLLRSVTGLSGSAKKEFDTALIEYVSFSSISPCVSR